MENKDADAVQRINISPRSTYKNNVIDKSVLDCSHLNKINSQKVK